MRDLSLIEIEEVSGGRKAQTEGFFDSLCGGVTGILTGGLSGMFAGAQDFAAYASGTVAGNKLDTNDFFSGAFQAIGGVLGTAAGAVCGVVVGALGGIGVGLSDGMAGSTAMIDYAMSYFPSRTN